MWSLPQCHIWLTLVFFVTFPYCLFNQLKEQVLCNIDNIYAQEAGLYSDKYKVAGRVDCIARYNGTPSIIDFKTSSRERTDDWNENYYIQGSAYAEMFGERTGIEVTKTSHACVIVVCPGLCVAMSISTSIDDSSFSPEVKEKCRRWHQRGQDLIAQLDLLLQRRKSVDPSFERADVYIAEARAILAALRSALQEVCDGCDPLLP